MAPALPLAGFLVACPFPGLSGVAYAATAGIGKGRSSTPRPRTPGGPMSDRRYVPRFARRLLAAIVAPLAGVASLPWLALLVLVGETRRGRGVGVAATALLA